MELHAVLKQYRKFEYEKAVVKNRIHIMADNHKRNLQKAYTIDQHLAKMERNRLRRKLDRSLAQRRKVEEKSVENRLKR